MHVATKPTCVVYVKVVHSHQFVAVMFSGDEETANIVKKQYYLNLNNLF